MTARVLLAIDRLDHGGPDSVYLNLLRFLPRDEVEPSLAVGSPHGRFLAEVPDDVEVHVVEERGGYAVDGLARLVRRLAPDVVLTTRRMNLAALAGRPLWPGRTRLVVRQTNHLSRNLSELRRVRPLQGLVVDLSHRLLLTRADVVLCQSQEMANDVGRHLRRPRPLPVIPNPVDVDHVLQRAARPLPDDVETGDPTFVGMGRLSPQKGFDLLVPAFARLLEIRPAARLWLLGDGEDRAALEQLAVTHGARDAVQFLGYRENPFPYLRAAQVFVSSSRYEGFSNALVEAMACGTPAVATAGPGVGDEVVVDGWSGWLAEPGSVASLLDALQRALAGAAATADEITEAMRHAYAPRQIATRYASLLREVAADATGGSRRSPAVSVAVERSASARSERGQGVHSQPHGGAPAR